MTEFILKLADPRADLATVGGKGASLTRLAAHGLPVPDGFHVTTEAYKRFVAENNLAPGIEAALKEVRTDRPATLEAAAKAIRSLFSEADIPGEVAGSIARAYNSLPGEQPAVAVRSSATAEDLPELSFAGQQETYLNIDTPAEVLQAVKRCWASLWTARAIAYRERNKIDQRAVSLAVVVQLLAPAEAAGILFTANPLSGRGEQMLINAAWGLGEAIVGGAVNPDTIVVDSASGRVIERQTADKQVMTVRVAGATQEQPTPDELRNAPVIDDEAAAELTCLGRQIEQIYGMPMDIEWAWADGKFAILQARPITALPEPQASISGEWILPKPKAQYMRGSLVDMMPSPVSPLFVSLGIPAIADMGIGRVMRVLTRSEPHLPRDYITTINHYAYMCASFSRKEWWWILSRMLPSFPRLMREGFTHWRDDIRPRYAQAAASRKELSLGEMTIAELWSEIQELVNLMGEYIASILVATTGSSAGTEMLFSRVYEKMVKREGDPEATAFLLGFNNIPIRAEKSLYDLAEWARSSPELADLIQNTAASELARLLAVDTPPAGIGGEIWREWQERFRLHLEQFGYVIYEVDFAKPLPLDDPTPMLQACKMYLRGEGGNPHERQQALEARRVQSAEMILKRTKGLRRWAFQKSLGLGQSRAEVREDAIADIGLGYPALRRALSELGERMRRAGVIEAAGDIYYLNKEEIEAALPALGGDSALPSLTNAVRQRRAEIEAAGRLNPPPMLPPTKKYLGMDMSYFVPMAESEQAEQMLKGIGASAGSVTAPACVLSSPADFERMQPGDVIVATITTPAWTPLFAMAAGVVTDIGGPLSHGSIVAREYGIPAVLGTGVATRRIQDGQLIRVDGGAGTVTLMKYSQPGEHAGGAGTVTLLKDSG